MPRFYSPEWVAAFNRAVADLDTGEVDTSASLAAGDGRFRVAQVVHGAPDGELRVTLVVAGGRLSLERDEPVPVPGGAGGPDAQPGGAGGPDAQPGGAGGPDAQPGGAGGPDAQPGGEAGGGTRPDVTVLLSYDDAAALSRGQLDPAQALGTGRVRVRGDLAVLVAGQALLAAAAGRLADLQATTTY